MKLYTLTEEQIIFIIQEAREVDWYEQNFDFTVEDITSQLTPIELPSDDYKKDLEILQNEVNSLTKKVDKLLDQNI